jgi:hypothetical protein
LSLLRFNLYFHRTTGRFFRTFRAVKPVNNLLSVSAEAEHPNFVNPPKGEFEARMGADPF